MFPSGQTPPAEVSFGAADVSNASESWKMDEISSEKSPWNIVGFILPRYPRDVNHGNKWK